MLVLLLAALDQTIVSTALPTIVGDLGGVFGVASIAGPLLGGFFVDNLSWRWIFYINLPLGVVALGVLGVVLPAMSERRERQIDYLGSGLLAASLSCIILATSLGGNTWAWDSAQLVITACAGVVLLVLLVFGERAAPEPVLPLRRFRNRTFTIAAPLGLHAA